MQAGYRAEVETRMKRLYVRLSEKDRRRYAAVEADKLGHGGFEYIAKLFEIDPKTIRQGLKDLEEGLVRLESGSEKKGRKSRLTDHPEWNAVFLDVVREHTAGNPQHGVIWTDLKPREIAQAMFIYEDSGSHRLTAIQGYPVQRLLRAIDEANRH